MKVIIERIDQKWMLMNDKRKKHISKFRLSCNIRKRSNKAFKSQNRKKTIETIDLIGCSQAFFKRSNLHQLYGDMTEENYGYVGTIDHYYPLSKTNLSNMKEMNISTYWMNLRPMYSSENSSKGSKIDNHLYLLLEIKANYFTNLNDKE